MTQNSSIEVACLELIVPCVNLERIFIQNLSAHYKSVFWLACKFLLSLLEIVIYVQKRFKLLAPVWTGSDFPLITLVSGYWLTVSRANDLVSTSFIHLFFIRFLHQDTKIICHIQLGTMDSVWFCFLIFMDFSSLS